MILVMMIMSNTVVLAAPADKVLALVNGDKITQADLDLYIEKEKTLLPKNLITYYEDWINKEDVLNELIWNRLAFQESRRLMVEYKTDNHIDFPPMLFDMRRKKETANIYKDKDVQIDYYKKNKKYMYEEPRHYLNFMQYESFGAAEDAVSFARSHRICDFASNYKMLMEGTKQDSCGANNINIIMGKRIALTNYPLDIIQQLVYGQDGEILGPFKYKGGYRALCVTKNTNKGYIDFEKFTSQLMSNKDNFLIMVDHNKIKDNAIIVIYK